VASLVLPPETEIDYVEALYDGLDAELGASAPTSWAET